MEGAVEEVMVPDDAFGGGEGGTGEEFVDVGEGVVAFEVLLVVPIFGGVGVEGGGEGGVVGGGEGDASVFVVAGFFAEVFSGGPLAEEVDGGGEGGGSLAVEGEVLEDEGHEAVEAGVAVGPGGDGGFLVPGHDEGGEFGDGDGFGFVSVGDGEGTRPVGGGVFVGLVGGSVSDAAGA